jgi:hypothetical protein
MTMGFGPTVAGWFDHFLPRVQEEALNQAEEIRKTVLRGKKEMRHSPTK